jgi:hypothetical protein
MLSTVVAYFIGDPRNLTYKSQEALADYFFKEVSWGGTLRHLGGKKKPG